MTRSPSNSMKDQDRSFDVIRLKDAYTHPRLPKITEKEDQRDMADAYDAYAYDAYADDLYIVPDVKRTHDQPQLAMKTEDDKPISPEEWSKLAGAGFTTSWFRSLNGFKRKYRAKIIQDVKDKHVNSLR